LVQQLNMLLLLLLFPAKIPSAIEPTGGKDDGLQGEVA
jgi:hypothetical protein